MTERVTLITGASAGIGVELARVFASKGHRVALVDGVSRKPGGSGKARLGERGLSRNLRHRDDQFAGVGTALRVGA